MALYNLLRPYNIVSLAGLSKNAGKTTVLRALLEARRNDREAGAAALAAIGVTATKPHVYVQAGTLVVTVTGCLGDCDFTKQILHTTGMRTPLGQVVVTKALSDGHAALAGPVTNSQLAELTEYLIGNGAKQVIIDGAGERKTFASFSDGAVVLCAGAAYDRDMYTVAAETGFLCGLFGTAQASPQIMGLFTETGASGAFTPIKLQGRDYFMCYGVLTGSMLEEMADCSIVVQDCGKIFAGRREVERFFRNGGELLTVKASILAAVVINPAAGNYNFAPDAFKAAVRAAVSAPVFNVLEND